MPILPEMESLKIMSRDCDIIALAILISFIFGILGHGLSNLMPLLHPFDLDPTSQHFLSLKAILQHSSP